MCYTVDQKMGNGPKGGTGMTIIQMRYFDAVCRWQNITKAAEHLHVSQPTVSVAMQALESETGLNLFQREGRKLLITHDGSRLLGKIRHILDQLDQLELAYAITVHKSQGSEFEAVVIPILGGFEKLYYRNLLYTAVTRAKKLLILVGSRKKIEEMVHNNRRTNRYSCLRHMLMQNEQASG